VTGRALLVGGGLFVGRRLLDALLAEGYRVDVLNRGRSTPPSRLPAGVRHRAADRGDPEAVRQAVGGESFDVVVDTSGYRPQEVRAVLANVEAGQYVYVSTLMVYAGLSTCDGQAAVGPLREVDELVPAYTGDGDLGEFYAGYKRACELVLLEQDRMPATVLRPCGIYGAGDYWYRHDYFFDRVIRQRPVLVPGTHLDRLVHLTDVHGLAEVCVRAIARPGTTPRVYNVADRDPVTYPELSRLCAVAAGVPPRILAYPPEQVAHLVATAAPRARFPFGTEPGFSLDCARVRRELDWPGTSLVTGTAALFQDFAARTQQGTAAEPDFSLDDALLPLAAPV
jgi:nucleoside-diphosphate-sugar epimerase